jgi:hypothetical protein
MSPTSCTSISALSRHEVRRVLSFKKYLFALPYWPRGRGADRCGSQKRKVEKVEIGKSRKRTKNEIEKLLRPKLLLGSKQQTCDDELS